MAAVSEWVLLLGRRVDRLVLSALAIVGVIGMLFGRPLHEFGSTLATAMAVIGVVALVAMAAGAFFSRRSAHRYADFHRRLLEHLPLATYVDTVAPSPDAIYASPQIEELLGYSLGEWMDDPDIFPQVLHPDDREAVLAAHAEAAARLEPLCLEYRLIARDGRTVWVRDQAIVRDEGGRPTWQGFMLDISEQKAAEEALRKTQELYRAVVENSADAISVLELDGTIRYASPGAARALGYAAEELVGSNFAGFVHPDDLGGTAAVLEQAVSGDSAVFVARVRHKDGTWRVLEGAPTAILDERGEPEAILAVSRDVTERQQAEEELRRLAHQNRLLLEAAGEGIVAVDERGRVTLINPAAARMLGYEPEEVIGGEAHALFHHTRADGSPYPLDECPISGVVLAGKPAVRRDDEVFWRKDGTSFPVEYTTTAVEEDGEVVGVVTVFRDISARKEAEDALREGERLYRDLFESAHDIIATVDLEDRITSVNKAFERVLGYGREEAVGMRLPDLLTSEGRLVSEEMTRRKLSGETETTTFELEHLAKDGTPIPLELSTHLIYRNGEPIGIQGVARDLSERRRLEEQLHHSQKMEAVGQLAGGVAHDFNNSLMAIRGYTELMLERLDHDEPLRRHAEGIRKAAEGATAVTRQLLAFSRKQMLQPRVLDVNDVVAGLREMLGRLIGEHIELVVDAAADLGRVRADPGQLEQVIVNLVVNARDAMEAGGTLTIETSNVELGSSRDLAPGPYVMLAVTDTGHGIPPEVRERVFEPFFSTKDHGLGTGLGLSTVYGIVRQSGGTVSVDSEPGRGSSFSVYLPRIDAEVRRETNGRARVPGGAERILLVEDEDAIRTLVAEMLGRLGYTVLEAANGTQALGLLKERPDEVDLLLTDVVMPDMRGPQLATRVSSFSPGTKVIYMSGYTNDTVLDGGGRDAHVTFLQKPFTSAELARTLRKVLDNGACG